MDNLKERPILFNGSMVRAILDGRKTVTRRLGKPVKHPDLGNTYTLGALVLESEPQHVIDRACPYGQPRERLWVRETWATDAQLDSIAPRDLSPGEPIRYHADGQVRQQGCSMISAGRSRPNIFMPRWASRILLEITEVQVERLQDISDAQALSEGVKACEQELDPDGNDYSPYELFSMLWVKINGMDSWHANPWVWAVEFKVLEVTRG